MSKELAIEKIQSASAVLALVKSLYRQLKEVENAKFDEMRGYFDFLVLLQTSIYSAVVLNLYHLLKDGEKHSLSKIVNLSVQHLDLKKETSDKLKQELADSEKHIERLVENRDKRIAHFDKKGIAPLDDKTLDHLLKIAENQLKTLNQDALKRDHSFDIPFSKGMNDCMEILSSEFRKITGK